MNPSPSENQKGINALPMDIQLVMNPLSSENQKGINALPMDIQ